MKEKFKAAAIRALHTMAQTALGVIGAATFADEVNWISVASASLLAGIVSILKSVIVGMPETPKTNADGESINAGYDEEDCE